MTNDFAPRLDILPPSQRQLWAELAAVPASFVLYGGTAVALHLGHRRSIDFDFFGNHRGGPVKLSFFGVPGLPRLASPLVAPDNGLRVAALLDLAGTKAAVVQQRAEAKDYRDLDAILCDGRIDLPTALAAAAAMYGATFNPQLTLKALSYFDDGNLPRLARATKDRLALAAREVDLDRLPAIARALP